MSVCHESELKSTSESIPDPNITDTKQRDIIAISPKIAVVRADVAKSNIVRSDKTITATFLFPMTLLLSYTITGITLTSSGFSTSTIKTQHIMVQIRLNGKATAIHVPKETTIPACSKYETAKAFCKLEIGVIIPPKLHANAKPSNNDFENLESLGRSLTIGSIIVAHRIGAV